MSFPPNFLLLFPAFSFYLFYFLKHVQHVFYIYSYTWNDPHKAISRVQPMKLFVRKDKLYWPKVSGPVGDQNCEIHINIAVFTCMLTALLPDRNSGGPQNFYVMFLVIRQLHALLHCPRKNAPSWKQGN